MEATLTATPPVPIPLDQRDGFIWYNGDLVPWGDAKLHILTHGLHYGSCVFEGERAYSGKIFRLHEHSLRLIESASILGFEIPYDVDAIDDACVSVLTANALSNAYVRPLAWRGCEALGVSAQLNRINMAIAVWDWPSYFSSEDQERGIRLDIALYRRPSPEMAPCHAKAAGLYMICTLSKHRAESRGYSDAMMLDWRGRVAETTGANMFFVCDDVIHTPVPDCFLDGITRRAVISLASARGYEVVERPIMPDELEGFSECFITGTAAEVTAVSEIGPYRFVPSDITRDLQADYLSLVGSDAD